MNKDIELIQIRDKYNLTQELLAQKLGVAVCTISNIERGVTKRSKAFDRKLNLFLENENKPVEDIEVYQNLNQLFIQNGISEEMSILLVTRIKEMTLGLNDFNKIASTSEIYDKSKKAYIEFLLEVLTQMKNITDVKRTSMITHQLVDIHEIVENSLKSIERKSKQITKDIYNI